jgi:tubulin-specific chaperone E
LHHAKNVYDNIQLIKKEIKEEEGKEDKLEAAITKKVAKIEYDAEAYLDTVKQKKKILIEFVGFDEIWHKINHLDKLQSISLAECKICDLGPLGNLNSLLKSVKVLSLEDNLLSDWQQIYQLGHELPQLNELSLAYNTLHEPSQTFQDLNVVRVTGRNESFPLEETPLFKSLRCLILIGTGLTWRSFFKVAAAFRQVHEFILCKNDLSDFQNIDKAHLDYLEETRFLNLEETRLTKFSDLQVFSKLPKLEKMILNKNELKQVGRDISGFEELKHLSVQHCGFDNPVVLYELSLLPNLESLHVKHNPIGDKLGNSYVRMRAVAEFPKLTQINGAQLKKVERKDFEIFYLRESFREYFAFKKVPDYDYDFNDFLGYCEAHHPNIPRLIKKFGNPYEVEGNCCSMQRRRRSRC